MRNAIKLSLKNYLKTRIGDDIMLKDHRIKRGLSQSQLASASGVSVRMIQYYEQGVKDINKASGETLYKLSKALDCKMEDLIEKEKEDAKCQ